MSDPWYDPDVYSWLPGTVFGTAGGLWGAVAGTLAPRGRGKRLVWGSWAGLAAVGLALMAAGLAGLATGQPFFVWYGLLLPGLQGPLLIGPLGWYVVRKAYRQAELRKLAAADL